MKNAITILRFPARNNERGFRYLNDFCENDFTNSSELVVDMTDVDSVTSSAISLIVKIYKKCEEKQIKFRLIHLSQNIYESFTNLNLNKLFEMEK